MSPVCPESEDLRGLLLTLLVIKRLVKTKALTSAVGSDRAVGISLSDELLATCINQKADEVRAHVVTGKVSENLGEVSLVEINVNKQETIKVLLRLDDQATIGAVDTSMTVVNGGISLWLNALGSVDLETLNRQALERCESPSTRLNSILGSDQVRGGVSIVGSRIRSNLTLFSRVDRPSSDVNLLTSRDVERLEEGVHVLPAVKLSNTTDVSLADGHEGVAGAISVDELLNVSRLDLATEVDDGTVGADEGLSEVESCVVDLREAEGDVDLVIAGCATDAAKFLRIHGHGVLAVALQHGEGLEVGDLPHPVGISRDPWRLLE
jgi:hypothetical protein